MLHSFDWYKVTRQQLIKILSSCDKHIINQKLSPYDIYKKISVELKLHIPICTRRITRMKNEIGVVYVGGVYYGERDQVGLSPITLILQNHPHEIYLTLNRSQFNKIKWSISDTILHEIIHMYQARSRNFDECDRYISNSLSKSQQREQEYLGSCDEIDAYAYNITWELYDEFNKNKSKITQYLDCPSETKKRKTSYIKYLETFDNDHSHEVILHLKERINHYLSFIETGSPFKE